MIPREILKKIRQIGLRTNRLATGRGECAVHRRQAAAHGAFEVGHPRFMVQPATGESQVLPSGRFVQQIDTKSVKPAKKPSGEAVLRHSKPDQVQKGHAQRQKEGAKRLQKGAQLEKEAAQDKKETAQLQQEAAQLEKKGAQVQKERAQDKKEGAKWFQKGAQFKKEAAKLRKEGAQFFPEGTQLDAEGAEQVAPAIVLFPERITHHVSLWS